MTKLYGFTKDYHFPYFCFGKKCFAFKISYSKYLHKFCKYFFKTTADRVLHTMVHNSTSICFYGIIKTNREAVYNLFDN